MIALELAEIALLLYELSVVVPAVEFPLVRDVVGWADHAPPVGAFEAALVVWSPINRHLFGRVDGALTAYTFVSRSPEHTGGFGRCRSLSIDGFLWLCNLGGSFKAFFKAASSLEELIEMRPAVQDSFK